jgi:hypothetical protein
MASIIYRHCQAQKQPIGAQAKFVFKMRIEAKKITQVLALTIQVIIAKVNTFYQLSKVKVPEFINQILSLTRIKGL